MTDAKVCEWCGSTFERPYRYSHKMWDARRFCSKSCRGKWQIPTRDDITYSGAHQRVKRELGLPHIHNCADCGAPATEYAFNNRSGADVRVSERGLRYSIDPSDYIPVCRACHRRRDRPTYCKHGHELTDDNTWRDTNQCLTCIRERGLRAYHKRKESVSV